MGMWQIEEELAAKTCVENCRSKIFRISMKIMNCLLLLARNEEATANSRPPLLWCFNQHIRGTCDHDAVTDVLECKR